MVSNDTGNAKKVYTASLNVPVKKALRGQAVSSNLSKICSQMNLDPETTGMDVVIFGPKDLIGPKANQVITAVANKHPDICVIYIYEKSADEDLIDVEYKRQCKKIKDTVIREAFEEFVSQHKMKTGQLQVTTADFEEQEDEGEEEVAVDIPKPTRRRPGGMNGRRRDPAPAPIEEEEDILPGTPLDAQEKDDIDLAGVPDNRIDGDTEASEPAGVNLDFDEPELTTGSTPVQEEAPPILEEPTPLDTSASSPVLATTPQEELPPLPQTSTLEESISRSNSTEDWALFKENLNKDAIVKTLIHENSEYVGLVQMLDVLDRRIEAVWRDSALSPEQKFTKIKEIGLEKSTIRATTNSMQVNKAISIITTIITSAKRVVDDKLESIDLSLYKISTDKSAIMDTSYIDRAIEERAKIQMELLQISRGIVDLYKASDHLVTEEILDLDQRLPSSNAFINDMVKPIGTQIFTPQNTAELVNKMAKALQNNYIVASQIEESVNSLIDMLFELCDKSEEIIRHQHHVIKLLEANRVEDVIITDSLLKKSMRIFVGDDNSGRSATAITWSGVLSRRNNTLLIDLTGRDKFRDYGLSPMGLTEFMENRVEQPFLCVKSARILDAEEIANLIIQLKTRLNYYAYVNIIVAPEDTDGLNQLCEEALTVHYVTNCSTLSIQRVKEIVAKNTTNNVARRLITIDTPVSPLMIADSVGIDPTMCRVVTLPAIPSIRACALRHDRPYEFEDIVKIFEEAFR